MPKNYPRAHRVEELAREVLGETILELKDPRIGFVTVTGVKLSADLRVATVYVSVFGSAQERSESIGAIRHARPHLRSVLGREVRMRYLPQLEVVEDQTAEHGERIEQLLRQAGASSPPPTDAREGDE